MLTLFDYPPSRNAWKVRQLLRHLGHPYRTEIVTIVEGAGRHPEYLAVNPTGTVPAIRLDDGRTLAESNAILMYLADGSAYLPAEPFGRAKVQQWLHFEQERVESVIGSLQFWALTGKLARRPPELVRVKREAGTRTLATLERELGQRAFIASDAYGIADISIYAYASRAEQAGFDLAPFPDFRAWLARVEAQPGFDATTAAYDTDPYSMRELP